MRNSLNPHNSPLYNYHPHFTDGGKLRHSNLKELFLVSNVVSLTPEVSSPFLHHHCAMELSMVMDMLHISAVQYGNH